MNEKNQLHLVLKWGTKDRQEMQETRNNMQTENRKLEEEIRYKIGKKQIMFLLIFIIFREKINTLWTQNEGLGNDAAAFLRTGLLEARQIEIDYIEKVIL